MSDETTIAPALTSDEWAEMRGAGDLIGRPYYYSGIVRRSAIAGMPEMGIALLNDLMPDDDPRKITRERVNLLRALGHDMRMIVLTPQQLDAELRAFADALASYLPPA